MVGTRTKFAKKKIKLTKNRIEIFCMASLGIVFLGIFAYAPMYGIILAFKDGDSYLNIAQAISKAEWIGLAHFKEFLTDFSFKDVMLNTLGLNLLQLLINFPAPIIFAILMNELTPKFKKNVQSITFFPHFISWVVFGGIFLSLLDFDTGIFNTLFHDVFKTPQVDILGDPRYFWGLIISTSLLKGLGWGSVIYVAAIAGIDGQLYEAAKMDGANRFHKIFYIILPSIAPTVTLFFILSVSGLLNNGFDHIWVFRNVNNISRSEVLDTFIYEFGITQRRYSYTTAVGLFKSAVALVLLTLSNFICKKISGKGIF